MQKQLLGPDLVEGLLHLSHGVKGGLVALRSNQQKNSSLREGELGQGRSQLQLVRLLADGHHRHTHLVLGLKVLDGGGAGALLLLGQHPGSIQHDAGGQVVKAGLRRRLGAHL